MRLTLKIFAIEAAPAIAARDAAACAVAAPFAAFDVAVEASQAS